MRSYAADDKEVRALYLKALEIQGFKSFPDKTVLTFGSDITAIVGPNGSGKSNISDAIRWVMGEQSSRSLRGSKMEDVIFDGTAKRKGLGFAEVTLVLDNTEHIFPLEESEVSVTYPDLPREVSPGTLILVDDGLIALRAEETGEGFIRCRVECGGELSGNKSINIPGVSIALPALTEKDLSDLRFAADNDFDYIAASFVRSADDVREIRAALDGFGGGGIGIIAKIENQQGVDNMDEIIAESNGVMVARGDLGVEIPAACVPAVQKKLIARCRRAGKTVIIATQMLDSMIQNPRPTRAEVSDVANAVYDSASCVMLSGETASGRHPLESLRTMCEIVCQAEKAIDYWRIMREGYADLPHSGISDAITHTCCMTAMDLGASAIITATQSGYTARMISRIRPECGIIALTPVERVYRQLRLMWGVEPFLCGEVRSTDSLFAACVSTARLSGAVKPGDTVVITAGVPIGRSGTTNLIKAQVIA